MSDQDDRKVLVLCSLDFVALVTLVRERLASTAPERQIDGWAELLTDMRKQWREQVNEDAGEQENP